jgi:hypothetical protein
MYFALINKDGELAKQQWFDTKPEQPNPVKGFTWYELKEVTPNPGTGEKVDIGYTITVESVAGIVTKTYKIVPKSAAELAEDQKAKDIIDNLPSWKEISDAIDAATTLAQMKVIVKKMAKVEYWLAKNSAT